MSNLEIAMHYLALTLIVVGGGCRLYFQSKAINLRAELRRKWWSEHDADMKEIEAGRMSGAEAGARRRARYHPG